MAVDTFQAATGTTQYVVIIRPSDGAWWNTAGTPAFEAFNAANYTDYDVAATEFGSTGLFQYTIPATLAAGVYNVASKKQAGGSPAASDSNGPAGQIYWDGSAVLSLGGVIVASTAAGAITAASIATGAIDADALAADAGTEIATAVNASALTESYRSAGETGTLAQLLYEIIAHLGESSISGTTKTLKKLDGSTTAKTYTLNSSTTPTAITETT